MKTCTQCKINKPVSDYWKNKNFCITCGKENNAKYHKNGYMRKYMANYYLTHDEAQKNKGDFANNYNKTKNRTKVYSKVKNNIDNGNIIKLPCIVCGSTKNIHGHHKDYNMPLDLTWLCGIHHKAVHKGSLIV